MKKIVIAGLINIETTIGINKFPIEYSPVDYNFFGINTTISGVGINVAKALKTLGGNPHLMSIISSDIYYDSILSYLVKNKIESSLHPKLEATPHSIIFYDKEGKRKISLDLKNIQDLIFPLSYAEALLPETSMAVVCNINFSRNLLDYYRDNKILIATDVHVVKDINDEFNKDYMQKSNILFLSNENIINKEKEFLEKLIKAYDNDIIVIGLGEKGAIMYVRNDKEIVSYPAQKIRPIINTIGAGDALFSCFNFVYNKTRNPYESLKKAIIFASYKIGDNGGATGFLSETQLDKYTSGSLL
jgi:ribokinase